MMKTINLLDLLEIENSNIYILNGGDLLGDIEGVVHDKVHADFLHSSEVSWHVEGDKAYFHQYGHLFKAKMEGHFVNYSTLEYLGTEEGEECE